MARAMPPPCSDEPLFCVELACRTFYWARAAYLYLVRRACLWQRHARARGTHTLSDPLPRALAQEPGSVIRKDVALRLFGLTDIEDIFVK